jgi:hypothetical protein
MYKISTHIIYLVLHVGGQTLSVLDSIMLLIAIYYVFDLEYPTRYAQMVGIIQHWVVGDAYTEQRCTNSVEL